MLNHSDAADPDQIHPRGLHDGGDGQGHNTINLHLPSLGY